MDVTASENFRTNLATAIDELGLKKSAIAAAAGMSRSHVDDVLKGKVVTTLPVSERLARAAGFTLISLLDAPENFSSALLTGVR
jgi:transcriptional regulator with XRE-family HTH domain